MRLLFPSLLAVLSGTFASHVRAVPLADSPCDACDHTIAAGTGEVNGTKLGIAPGQNVCLQAGEYPYIRFREIRGTLQQPITILNCGGAVDVHNTDRGYGVDFQGNSKFFHLTGTGTPGLEYGIRISASRRGPDYPGMGLWFLDKSTNYEADHLEVHDTGFAGVMAKTDPLCDGSADQETFVQQDVHLHHLWVHDTGGEGFYVGSTQSGGQDTTCNGVTTKRQPHYLEGIEIDHNLVENTEWDGMQVGMARQGCLVHHNVIRNVGTAGAMYQQQAVQIGTFSACAVVANDLRDGPAMGVFVLGAGDTTVANNLLANFAEDAIYMNISGQAPARYAAHFNTMLGFGGSALRVFGPGVTAAVSNNFVVGPSTAIGIGGDLTASAVEYNVFVPDTASAGFVGSSDFHLTATSPARGAGKDLMSLDFSKDLDGHLRANPPSVGAYEYRENVPESAPDPASPDAGTSDPPGPPRNDGGSEDSQGASSEGGCSVRPSASEPRSAVLFLLCVAGLVSRSGRVRSRATPRRSGR